MSVHCTSVIDSPHDCSLYPGCFIKLGMGRTQVIITLQLLRIMSEFIIDSVIWGFHVYKSLWTPEIGEDLSTVRETSNTHDRFPVAIRKGTLTIGHVPAEISKVCCFFFFWDMGVQLNWQKPSFAVEARRDRSSMRTDLCSRRKAKITSTHTH